MERVVANLTRGLVEQGCVIDLLLVKARSGHLADIPPAVNIIKLQANHTLTALPALTRYLQKNPPTVLMAVRHRAIKIALLARWRTGSRTPITGQVHTTVSVALQRSNWLKKVIWYAEMRLFYPWLQQTIGVSQGVADDVRCMAHLPEGRVRAIYNPVITPELHTQAQQSIDHPWFSVHDVPVIVSIGRLTRQKDFPTLIRAFARLRQNRPCRLLILGEGGDRTQLEALIQELGVSEDVELPGFVSNPYAYLAKADLFALSSRWEGSPTVLTEALALGVPAVSTDCPSGPQETLQGGRYGKLVTMGNADALAEAMAQTLDHPLPTEQLQDAVSEYTIAASARNYLHALDLEPSNNK